MTTASLSFSTFDQGQAIAAQPVETKPGEFSAFVKKAGDRIAHFFQGLAKNLGKTVASTLIAGVLVAGAMTAITPALPVGGALVAGGFAAQAARTVVEAVLETAVEQTVSAVSSAKPSKPSTAP